MVHDRGQNFKVSQCQDPTTRNSKMPKVSKVQKVVWCLGFLPDSGNSKGVFICRLLPTFGIHKVRNVLLDSGLLPNSETPICNGHGEQQQTNTWSLNMASPKQPRQQHRHTHTRTLPPVTSHPVLPYELCVFEVVTCICRPA